MIEHISAGTAQSLEVKRRYFAEHAGELALVVESADTQRIQETYNLIGHILCELVERMLFEED